MTIKQLGGVFGRNPTFNNVTIEGTLTFDGDIDINSDLTIGGNLDVTGTVTADGLTVNGITSFTQKAVFGNNKELRWIDSGGTERTALVLDSSNDLNLGTSAGGNLKFYNGSSYVERMRIDSSGNVGIGTSSISYPFVVSDGGNLGFEFSPNDQSTGVNRLYSYDRGTSAYKDFKLSASEIIFGYGSSGGNEAMRIDGSGNLLVGTTDTFVGDNSSGGGISFASGGAASFARSAGTVMYVNRTGSSAGKAIEFRYNGGDVGNISITASATAYNTSSDQRLKENIADADDAGSKIDSIQVRKFDWKADGSHQDYGMVAQELLEVAPEAVSAPEDPEDMMGVDYSKLVPMMLKEIQSLRARIAQLEP
jgi:hypothetical protein